MLYAVSWDDYQKNINAGFGALQQRGEFVDMTIAAEGHHVKVHQMILSLVSPYIKDLIISAKCPHPIIFLNKVSYHTLQSILEYAYSGEVVVHQDRFSEFLQASQELRLKGLEHMLNMDATSRERYTQIEPEHVEILPATDNISRTSQDKTDDIGNALYLDEYVDTLDHIDDDDDDDADVGLQDKNTPNNEELREIAPVGKLAPFQYSMSCHGNLQIVLNRFIYSLKYTRKDNQRFWRCISQQDSNCLAYVTTEDKVITKRARAHNHAYHDRQILKRVQNKNMFTAIDELEEAIAKKKWKRNEDDKSSDKIVVVPAEHQSDHNR